MASFKGFTTYNPTTDQVLREYSYHTPDEINAILEKVPNFKEILFKERMELFSGFLSTLREKKEDFAQLITEEMGKPISDARAEVEKSIAALEFILLHADRYLTYSKDPLLENFSGTIIRDPLGCILTVMPYNYPLWQLVRILGSAFVLGNPILLKHSEVTAGVGEFIDEIFKGLQSHFLQNIRIPVSGFDSLISAKKVRAVTLTGSLLAGRNLAALAGKHLKKVVLELGGSDAYCLLSDGDLDLAVKVMVAARMVNNGQSCIAAKRFYIHESLYHEFKNKLFREILEYIPQDPRLDSTKISVLGSPRFADTVRAQVENLNDLGLQKIFDLRDSLEINKSSMSQSLSFFPAQVFEVDSSLPLLRDLEIFGPVFLLYKFSQEDQLVKMINESEMGLGAAIFTASKNKFSRIADQLEVGLVAHNQQIKSDVRYPFGGCKNSGFGRELGISGFSELSQLKVQL